mmetsp:Transcript_42797/g.93427  ORF Transcript_42797/g.93427 Transcript_42797/m.93427 type:complete len:87 (+) Transcript_42797:1948-2208(+)
MSSFGRRTSREPAGFRWVTGRCGVVDAERSSCRLLERTRGAHSVGEVMMHRERLRFASNLWLTYVASDLLVTCFLFVAVRKLHLFF